MISITAPLPQNFGKVKNFEVLNPYFQYFEVLQ